MILSLTSANRSLRSYLTVASPSSTPLLSSTLFPIHVSVSETINIEQVLSHTVQFSGVPGLQTRGFTSILMYFRPKWLVKPTWLQYTYPSTTFPSCEWSPRTLTICHRFLGWVPCLFCNSKLFGARLPHGSGVDRLWLPSKPILPEDGVSYWQTTLHSKERWSFRSVLKPSLYLYLRQVSSLSTIL